MNKKDNPVPLLENIVKEFYRDHYSMYRRGSFDFPSEEEFVQEEWDLWKSNNPQYFKHGVETNNEQPNYYVVLLCGCTDCFPHAAFFSKDSAEKWAKENSKNPEGFIIKKYSGIQLLNRLNDID